MTKLPQIIDTPALLPNKQTLFPDEGAACVARVFERAYHDIAPMALHGPASTNTRGGSAAAAAAAAAARPLPPPSPSPPAPASKIPAPIGRVPAAASLRSSPVQLQQRRRASGGGGGPGIPRMPPPATGLAELLVEELGMGVQHRQHQGFGSGSRGR